MKLKIKVLVSNKSLTLELCHRHRFCLVVEKFHEMMKFWLKMYQKRKWRKIENVLQRRKSTHQFFFSEKRRKSFFSSIASLTFRSKKEERTKLSKKFDILAFLFLSRAEKMRERQCAQNVWEIKLFLKIFSLSLSLLL